MPKINHEPWRPSNEEGIDGHRVAIVGYSHHLERGDVDYRGLTKDVVRDVMSGRKNLAFYTSIRNYFGYDSHEDFWSRVLFFNFLPNSVGNSDNKYGIGSPEQTRLAKKRILHILSKERPSKVFVFTKKGWRNFPDTIENDAGRRCTPLIPESLEPSWGTYKLNGHRVLVCGFRHPQYAKGEDISRQVKAFLAVR